MNLPRPAIMLPCVGTEGEGYPATGGEENPFAAGFVISSPPAVTCGCSVSGIALEEEEVNAEGSFITGPVATGLDAAACCSANISGDMDGATAAGIPIF